MREFQWPAKGRHADLHPIDEDAGGHGSDEGDFRIEDPE